MRQITERLVNGVKVALVANKCSSVFWIGNLKNKDLHGDEIISQLSSISSQDQDDENNENQDLPEDDDDLEDDLGITALEDFGNDSVNASRSKCI